jgi:hypothetical protein
MIYIYGDSHANYCFNNLHIPHFKYHENSITMFRIGRDNLIVNFDKEFIVATAATAATASTIVFTYGEIDCRCHIHRQKGLDRDEDEIIRELVNNYIDTIKNNTEGLDANIFIVAVIPPTKQSDYELLNGQITHDFPFFGCEADRVRYTSKVNTLLESSSVKYGYTFFNPYDYYRRADGTLKYELSDNTVHIGDNRHFLEMFMGAMKGLKDKPHIK